MGEEENVPTRKVKVTVDRTPEIQRLEEELEVEKQARQEAEQVLTDLAEKAFEEKKEELASRFPEKENAIMNVESPSQLEIIESLLGTETKNKPTGVVGLIPPKNKGSLASREFSSKQEAFENLFNRDDMEAEEIKDKLFSKSSDVIGKWQLRELPPKRQSLCGRYIIYPNLKGGTCYVPEEDAKRLSPEELRKRISEGWY